MVFLTAMRRQMMITDQTLLQFSLNLTLSVDSLEKGAHSAVFVDSNGFSSQATPFTVVQPQYRVSLDSLSSDARVQYPGIKVETYDNYSTTIQLVRDSDDAVLRTWTGYNQSVTLALDGTDEGGNKAADGI